VNAPDQVRAGRRVVVTGMGVVSSAGVGCAALADAAAAGRCTLTRISDQRVAHFRARFAGLVHAIPSVPEQAAVGSAPDRHVLLALAAAAEALDDAGLRAAPRGPRMGLVHATCSGPMLTIEQEYAHTLRGPAGPGSSRPESRRYDSGALALSRAFGITGPVATVVTACSASTCAIGTACDLIRAGLIDCALVGGADAFSLTTLAGFDALRATCEGRCAPFSKPIGMCLGEAGAYVVLETLESARARGARQRAEIAGYGSSNDAYHCSAPDPQGRGAVLAIRRALADGGLGPEAIGYVNAHGTGTESNDKAESRALRAVFGEHGPAVSATKSVTGHCLGAAGTLELIASLLCAERNVLPPTANFTAAREGCALAHVTGPGTVWPAARTLASVNLAFGGHDACVAVVPGPAEDSAVRSLPAEGVVVTGCGVVTPRTIDMAALAARLRPFGQPQEGAPVAGPGLDLSTLDRRLDPRGMDSASAAAVAAGILALRQAGMPLPRAGRGSDLGLCTHVMHAPLWAEAAHLRAVLAGDYHVDHLTAFPYVVANAVNGVVARALGLTGHNATFALGEGAGATGLALACCAVGAGRAPALLSIAVDEGRADDTADRGNPDGTAAAGFLLETGSGARARQAAVLATVRAVAFAGPGGSGRDRAERLAELVRTALSQAGVTPRDIGVVCGDLRGGSEFDALRRVAPELGVRALELEGILGRGIACGATLNLAVLLGATRVEGVGERKYILLHMGSPSGYDTVVALSRGPSA